MRSERTVVRRVDLMRRVKDGKLPPMAQLARLYGVSVRTLQRDMLAIEWAMSVTIARKEIER